MAGVMNICCSRNWECRWLQIYWPLAKFWNEVSLLELWISDGSSSMDIANLNAVDTLLVMVNQFEQKLGDASNQKMQGWWWWCRQKCNIAETLDKPIKDRQRLLHYCRPNRNQSRRLITVLVGLYFIWYYMYSKISNL